VQLVKTFTGHGVMYKIFFILVSMQIFT